MRKAHEPNLGSFANGLAPDVRAHRQANRILFGGIKADKRKKLASRNAYRRAIGLPEIKSP